MDSDEDLTADREDDLIHVSDLPYDWERTVLRDLHVVGIGHDQETDLKIEANRPTNNPIVKAAYRKWNNTAILDDGRVVGLTIDECRFPGIPDDRLHPVDEGTRTIEAMLNLGHHLSLLLSMASPGTIDELMRKTASVSGATGVKFLDNLRTALQQCDYIAPEVDPTDYLRLYADMLDEGIIIPPDVMKWLVLFMRDRVSIDRIPNTIITMMRNAPMEDWSEYDMGRHSLKDFNGHDHIAWSVVALMMRRVPILFDADETTVSIMSRPDKKDEASPRIEKLVRMFMAMDADDSGALGRLDDEIGDDYGRMAMVLNLIKTSGRPASCSWLGHLLRLAKSADVHNDSELTLKVMEEDMSIMMETSSTVFEAISRHEDRTSMTVGFLPYVFASSAEALRGARLLRDEPLIGLGPDDEDPGEDDPVRLIDLAISCVHGEFSTMHGEGVLSYDLMVFLEDISRAHDEGVSLLDLDAFVREYGHAAGEYNCYRVRDFMHWMVRNHGDNNMTCLPYSFYSELPDFQEYWNSPGYLYDGRESIVVTRLMNDVPELPEALRNNLSTRQSCQTGIH